MISSTRGILIGGLLIHFTQTISSYRISHCCALFSHFRFFLFFGTWGMLVYYIQEATRIQSQNKQCLASRPYIWRVLLFEHLRLVLCLFRSGLNYLFPWNLFEMKLLDYLFPVLPRGRKVSSLDLILFKGNRKIFQTFWFCACLKFSSVCVCVCVCMETGSCHVAQAGFELLGSSDPTSASHYLFSKKRGTSPVCHRVPFKTIANWDLWEDFSRRVKQAKVLSAVASAISLLPNPVWFPLFSAHTLGDLAC